MIGIIYTIYLWTSYFYSKEENKDIKVVEVERISLSNITQTARLIGTIQAKRSTVLLAKTIGTLDHIVHAGQKIPKGSLIAKLENVDLEETYKLSESAEEIAHKQYDRIVSLEKSKLAKIQDVEDRRNQWIEAQKSLAAAKIEFEKTRFIAPFDGVVGVFKMREGVQVQVGDPIVIFYDPSELIVEFDIPTPIFKQIYQEISASQNSIQKVFINGKMIEVSHIQRMIDPDTHMSPAYVDFQCADCMIGSTIMVDLVVATHNHVMVVPYQAVFLRDGKTCVYLVKGNKTSLCPVTLGIREKEKVEITTGLVVGDQVVIRGQERLSPDMDVKIFDPPVEEKKRTSP